MTFAPQQQNTRGLDSGLAKACPSAEGFTQKTYRSYRRRLELFEKQCTRRGHDTAVEGAYLVISSLRDVAWDATEQLDFNAIESAPTPFRALYFELYQYEDLIEVPSRCDEFFSEFSRNKGEELQAYLWKSLRCCRDGISSLEQEFLDGLTSKSRPCAQETSSTTKLERP